MREVVSEKVLERKVSEVAGHLGCLSIKITSAFNRGLPDRLILMPGGRCCFVEVKTTGKRPTPLQTYQIRGIKSLGCEVFVVDSLMTLISFEQKLREMIGNYNNGF